MCQNDQYPFHKKCSNTDYFPALYFPVFGLNTEIYSVALVFSANIGKHRPEKNCLYGKVSQSDNDVVRSDT